MLIMGLCYLTPCLMVIRRQCASSDLRVEEGSGATPCSSRKSESSAFVYSRLISIDVGIPCWHF